MNIAPDLVAKIAVEPGWGHWEAFGIGRFFRDRIYPTTGTPYNDMEPAGGIGGGFRGPLASKKFTIGLKGLYGVGVGRYGNSTIADVTVRPTGVLEPLKAFSALSTVEMNPTPRLNIYLNYGGDYVYRDFVVSGTNSNGNTYAGYGVGGPGIVIANAPAMTGCLIEAQLSGSNGGGTGNQTAPANCAGNTKDVRSSLPATGTTSTAAPRAVCARASRIKTSAAISGPATAARPTPAAAHTATTTCSSPRSVTTCRNLRASVQAKTMGAIRIADCPFSLAPCPHPFGGFIAERVGNHNAKDAKRAAHLGCPFCLITC